MNNEQNDNNNSVKKQRVKNAVKENPKKESS